MHTIELFMWGYQEHFRTSAERFAGQIFSNLDKNLKPKVFLVGILSEDREDSHPVCVEPEDCGYNPDLFLDVKNRAHQLEKIRTGGKITFFPLIKQEKYESILNERRLKDLKNAIQEVIDQKDKDGGVISFCSLPVLVKGYAVCVVLQIERSVFNNHYSLVKNKFDEYDISVSFLDATITEYLNECRDELSKPDPGSTFDIFKRPPEEIIRSAGKILMYTPALAGGEGLGLHGLFDACNTISSLRYESDECIGKMLIAGRKHPNIEVTIRLSSPVRVSDYLAVRKLLEISSNDVSLLSDSGYIYGLGKLIKPYDEGAENLFLINFTKHHTWELSHADHVMMQVTYGQPNLQKMKINEENFKRDIKKIFQDIDSGTLDNLWKLIDEATKQKHGTMVVISKGAQEEADRLQTQCIKIEPVKLTPEIMRMVTAIDGAVLICPNTTCYAIGVILDGLDSNKGDSSRGARYNSANRYVESSEYSCVAIVVSQDGSIDIFP